jgi:hypothetical protein
MTPQELSDFTADHLLFGDLPGYLRGRMQFKVPIYAVWGNHEDKAVVEAFRNGRYHVQNLHLLDEREIVTLGNFAIFGLGGDIIRAAKLFDKPLAGDGGKIWCTASQIGQLFETAKAQQNETHVRILVTHVSPSKEPLINLISAHLETDFIISGHMGPPYCNVWSEFTIRELAESEQRLRSVTLYCQQLWKEFESRFQNQEERHFAELGAWVIGTLPDKDSWYRNTFSLNLPDAEQGHAIMAETKGRISIETFSNVRPSIRAKIRRPRSIT